MKSHPWDVQAEQEVVVQVNGNLQLTGWDRPELQAQASDLDSITFSSAEGRVTVQTTDGCVLQVPAAARLRVESVYGNASIADLSEPFYIQRIGGNLNLARVGPGEVEKVYGNLKVFSVGGDLRMGAVYGNVSLQDVLGGVLIEEIVKGNLVIREANRVEAAALGNATLMLAPQTGEEVRVEASGNIHCTLAGQVGAQVEANSQACQIRLRTGDTTRSIEESHHALTVGEGGARVHLAAKGFVRLTWLAGEPLPEVGTEAPLWDAVPPGPWVELQDDAAAISEEINELIEKQMEALETRLADHLSRVSELGVDTELQAEVEEIVAQARQYSTRAAQRAQERAQAAAERAQSKLSRRLEKARRKAERKARKSGSGSFATFTWASGRGSAQMVSEEEQLLILKMLEEDKITAEEAEALLSALEGSEG